MVLDVMMRPHTLIASDRIEGTAVRRANGERIGHIERLMIDKISGKVSYAVLSFGGFFGLGSNLLPLPWAKLTFNRELDAYQLDIADDVFQLDIADDVLKSAPSFSERREFDWGDRSQEEALHRHYGVAPYWGEF